jgi:DNA-binding beta-propeller fold protein YncE
MRLPFATALVCVLAACGSTAPAPASSPRTAASVPGYRTVAEVRLPGLPSRWDYAVLDGRAGRLYLAHQGADEVVAVDTARLEVLGTVRGIESVQGLALASAQRRLYASATGRNEVAVIDVDRALVVARIPAGEAPDGLAYVSSPARLFVSDSAGSAETVIDLETNQPIARVELGDGIGDSQFDPWTGRVLVAVAARRELVAIDPATAAVVARYPLPGCSGAQAVQVDVSGHDRAFVSCQGNARLLGLDLETGAVVATLEVGQEPDILSLDSGLHRLYVASESGVLTVVGSSAGGPVVMARGPAGPDAHSVVADPDTHRVYLPLSGIEGRSVLRVLAPG